MAHALNEVSRFTNTELVCEVKRLVKADRALSAKLLVHLGEMDARRLYLELGYASMFEYCRSGLGMSEGEASLRILAARVGRRLPLVLERLGAGAVHLSAIKLLAPHLTADNHAQLLDSVRGMTKRQIEVFVAELAPKPDVPARIRKVAEPRARIASTGAAARALAAPTFTGNIVSAASVAPALKTHAGGGPETAESTAAAVANPFVAQPSAAPGAACEDLATFALESPRPRATSTPLGLGRFKVQLMLGREAHTALEQLVELSRHQNPSGDITYIVERALCELLKSTMKRRFGQTKTNPPPITREPAPAATLETEATNESRETSRKNASNRQRPQKPSLDSRYIARAILREVHARADGQCTYVSPEGRRCTERGFLEVHHHNTTFARGGEATAENLRLVCRAHNMYYAERDYGRALMHDKLRAATARKQLTLVPDADQL